VPKFRRATPSNSEVIIIYYASKAAHHIYTVKKTHTHANMQHKILQLKSAYTKKHTLKYTL